MTATAARDENLEEASYFDNFAREMQPKQVLLLVRLK
jgi:hypothetical protein